MVQSASSRILALASTAKGATNNFLTQDLLERSFPGYGLFQGFFATWLRLDLSKVAAIFVILTGASSALKTVAPKLYRYFMRFFTAAVSIPSNDRLNKEVLNWIGANVLTQQGTRILTARSEVIKDDSWSSYRKTRSRNDLDHDRKIPIQYFPTYDFGMYTRGGGQPDEYATAPEGREPLVVMCLGRSAAPIKRFLDACSSYADKQKERFTTVRTSKSNRLYSFDEPWDTTILRAIRPLETVHFDETTKSELVADIKNYLEPATRRFYTIRGIPYRRGYLLHGPPGTGKTSLSLALAGRFNLELYLLHIPSVRDDTELEKYFASLPPKCIVLLEDIDAIGMKRDPGARERSTPEYNRGRDCTLSGLLNVLDGVASQEGRIVLMTSNFADKLDKALIRPGRIDKMIYLGWISQESAKLMFLRMYSHDASQKDSVSNDNEPDREQLNELAEKFGSMIPENKLTPAQVQGFLLSKRNAATAAADCAESWVKETITQMEEEERREREARAKARRRRARHSSDSDSYSESTVSSDNELGSDSDGEGEQDKKEENAGSKEGMESRGGTEGKEGKEGKESPEAAIKKNTSRRPLQKKNKSSKKGKLTAKTNPESMENRVQVNGALSTAVPDKSSETANNSDSTSDSQQATDSSSHKSHDEHQLTDGTSTSNDERDLNIAGKDSPSQDINGA